MIKEPFTVMSCQAVLLLNRSFCATCADKTREMKEGLANVLSVIELSFPMFII